MNFVDEQNNLTGAVHHFLHHALQTLFKFTLILGAGNQRAHIQGVDLFGFQVFGHLPVHDVLGNALGDGRLAHARLAHQDRVVLGAAGQDLQHTANLVVTADYRIQFALCGPLVQVDSEPVQKCVVTVVCHNLFSFLPLFGGNSSPSISVPRAIY